MREFLEKEEVTRQIKPIYRDLIVIDLLVCSLLIGDFFNLIHLGVFMLPIFFLLLCSVSALNKLREFDNSSSLGLNMLGKNTCLEKKEQNIHLLCR